MSNNRPLFRKLKEWWAWFHETTTFFWIACFLAAIGIGAEIYRIIYLT